MEYATDGFAPWYLIDAVDVSPQNFMLTTNLLPEENRKIIKYEDAMRILVFFTIISSFVFLIGVVLLLPSYLPLWLEYSELKRRLELEKEASRKLGVEEIVAQINHVRSSIFSISSYASISTQASGVLEPFVQETYPGISIFTVSTKEGGETFIKGNSRNRKDLLNFENTLRLSNRFQNISYPFSSIIRESNINFTIEGKLKIPHSL